MKKMKIGDLVRIKIYDSKPIGVIIDVRLSTRWKALYNVSIPAASWHQSYAILTKNQLELLSEAKK
jgi:hypothetical protein